MRVITKQWLWFVLGAAVVLVLYAMTRLVYHRSSHIYRRSHIYPMVPDWHAGCELAIYITYGWQAADVYLDYDAASEGF